MDIRNFNIREATWTSDKNCILGLRRLIFKKTNLDHADEQDEVAWHWIALDAEDRAMGCVRVTPDGNISHLLVLPEYQNQKTGKTLLECALKKARHLELLKVHLESPKTLIPYFESLGFKNDSITPSDLDLQSMMMAVDRIDSVSQRKLLSSTELNAQVRDYDTTEANWNQHQKAIIFLQHQVIVIELGFDKKGINEEDAKLAFHFITRKDDQIIGSAQFDRNGRISKLVVDADYRRKGVASSLLESVEIKAQRLGVKKMSCLPTPILSPFLQNQKFEPEHSDAPDSVWVKDVITRSVEKIVSTPKQQTQHKVVLGEVNDFLILRSNEAFQNVIVDMCQQAKHSLHILSPFLDHALFDQLDLREICSALARKNKHTNIEILLFDPHRVIKNGHCLVELSRRLPSSMNIRIVDPEMRNSNHEYVIVDGRGYIYRQEVDLYDGCANFYDVTESNRLLRQFRRSWESSVADPNLRQLKL
ncbi:MAG: GNAT family N-acetyltransferase [Pseudomonadales bacterium]|nr:GNAT family N-acetyltransferase [Pseudomonadales bacterium]